MAAPRLRSTLVYLSLLLLLVLQLSSLSAVVFGQEAEADEPLEFDPADESAGRDDWDEDDDASQGLLGEIVSSIREQPIAQRTLLDSLVVWVLLNPREFVFGCACLLVPLFAVAIGSAYCMIRDMGAAARAAAEERREMQQLRAKQATTIAEEQAGDGHESGEEEATENEALRPNAKKNKKQQKHKSAAATEGVKQRPRANSAARR